ncbi:hypothetical protein MPSEU_000051100 [Mayamaea pseudoterrestris]|nr:hypothetical protein MPSEU_000051100 [Mayamaea pseudoterrestris]
MLPIYTRPRLSGSLNRQCLQASTVSVLSRLFLSTTTQQLQETSTCIDSDNHQEHNHDFDNDTIFALSSGSSLGQATAVAVVRVSGPMAAQLLQSMTNKPTPKPRRAVVRDLVHPVTHEPLDQALVLWFAGPQSFTGQDVLELHCHGSRAVVEGVLQVLSEWNALQEKTSQTIDMDMVEEAQGANNIVRLADPGEFTRRAWQSGKLNLLQVEALADLLAADTSTQRVQALGQLQQQSSSVLDDWRLKLIAGLAHAEAVIDFGDDENLGDDEDDDANDPTPADNSIQQQQTAQWTIWGNVQSQMQDLRHSMERHLYHDGRRGELVRTGVRIAILGPPNAGKSSLLNLLAQREAAIVSPLPGTTRDVVEVALNLGGVKCLVQDTAGLRRFTNDVIERKGMERATQAAAEADMVLVMVDGSATSGLSSLDAAGPSAEANAHSLDEVEEMKWLLQSILPSISKDNNGITTGMNHAIEADAGDRLRDGEPQVMLVINKSDLQDVNAESGAKLGITDPILARVDQRFEISCATQAGVDDFLESLTSKVVARVSEPSDESEGVEGGNLITRTRHRQHVQAAVAALERFDDLSGQGTYAVDMAAEELRLAASELGRITGAVDVEDVLDKLFSDFCIGK